MKQFSLQSFRKNWAECWMKAQKSLAETWKFIDFLLVIYSYLGGNREPGLMEGRISSCLLGRIRKKLLSYSYIIEIYRRAILTRRLQYMCNQSCESRRQTNSTCSRPRFREIWKVSSLSRSLPLSVSPRSRPRFGFPRPPHAENESSIAVRGSRLPPPLCSVFSARIYRKNAVLRIRIRDPGLGAFWPLDPGYGIGFFRIPDLGSRIPRPYF